MFGGEIFTDGADPVGDAPVIIVGFPAADTLVEFIEGVHFGYRGQPVAPEPADFAFHTTFFVRTSDTGLAIERIKTIVRSEQNPALILGAARRSVVPCTTAATALVRLS